MSLTCNEMEIIAQINRLSISDAEVKSFDGSHSLKMVTLLFKFRIKKCLKLHKISSSI